MKYKARPKTYVMYRIATFDGKAKCLVDCYPQQKWHYGISDKTVTLERKGLTLMIPREDFEKHWKVVPE